MTRNYLTHRIERLPDPPSRTKSRSYYRKVEKEKKRLISQKAASEKYGVPALHIKWAIEAGRIDHEWDWGRKRRFVVDNRRLYEWARNHRRQLDG